MPKVSILITAYNSRKYLPATLESVFSQTYTDYEIVIVNDGSTDSTAEWIEAFDNPKIRLISKENEGLSIARNTGIAHISSDYIAILDHDDLWLPTKLEKQVEILETQPDVGFVYTWTALADEQGQPTGKVVKSDPQDNAWRQLLEFNFVGCGSTPLIRKECFDTVGEFEPELVSAEDWDMWLRIARHYKFAVVKEPLVLYRLTQSNISSNYDTVLTISSKVIEKAYRDVAVELLPLRNRSYSSLYLYLGWRALSCNNIEKAIYSLQSALKYRPLLIFSPRYWRLKGSMMLVKLFGPSGFTNLRHIKSSFTDILGKNIA